MSNELELAVKHLDEVNSVAIQYLKGDSETKIAKSLGLTRQKVVDLLNEWRLMAANNQAVRARAREALAGADLHFTQLIAEAHEVLRDAGINADNKEKLMAIKAIADMEARRIDLLHRAGMLDNRELADNLADMEKKFDAMKRILNTVLCPDCKLKVMRELQAVSSEAVTMDV